jgi:cell wall-associated NlpC family hydrolase
MKNFPRTILSVLIGCLSINSWSDNPIFLVTPNTQLSTPLIQGQAGTAIFQVINNSNRTLKNISLVKLPAGTTQIYNPGPDYCTNMSVLDGPGSLCLIEVQINTNQSGNFTGGPVVCALNGVFCSQPYSPDQMTLQVQSGPVPQTCQGNESNFSAELTQTFDSGTIDPATINSWGPARNQLFLSTSNPNLTSCPTTNPNNSQAIAWMQQRVLAAENFWVIQKLNYCHHHVTDFYTPTTSYGTPRTSIGTSSGGYCSNAVSLAPSNYGQQIRWNYSGNDSQTSNSWVNQNRMWYGVDCSDFTSFVYNFAFGIQFNSDTGYQAGQATNGSQDSLLPNTQTTGNVLGVPTYTTPANDPAGVLVCKDGTAETRNGSATDYCGSGPSGPVPSNNGYFSVFLNTQPATTDRRFPVPTPSNVTSAMLNTLQPGDLIFLAFSAASGQGGDGNNPTSVVTHVITWTGKKIGYGPNDVNPSQIAPESICPNNWQPQIGDWAIIDSHYQGPDYRDFTPCFYQNNIYAVRRVIGYQHS